MIFKEKVKVLVDKAKEFAGKHHKYFFQVLKEYWLLFALIILELWLAQFIVAYLLSTSAFNFLWLLVVYTLWLITFYIFFQKDGSNWLEKHQTFLAVLAIILPIMLFFLQDSTQIIQS